MNIHYVSIHMYYIYICIYIIYIYVCIYIYIYIVCDHEITQVMQFAETVF